VVNIALRELLGRFAYRNCRIPVIFGSPTKDPIDNILMEPHMPWTSNSVFEARRNFVMLALLPNSNIRGLCRRFNISAKTAYQTLERYRAEGEKGLQDRSHAPHRSPLRCSKATECESAWNKDPVFGVIGIQTGPRG
jgi:hypothetical protein